MSVRIRLQRKGRKKRPFYRVVVADRQAPRDGRFVELVGTYDPLQDPPKIELKTDRIDYWIGQGAEPSDTVRSLIKADAAGPEAMAAKAAAKAEKKAKKVAEEEAAKAKAEAEEKAKAEAEAAAEAAEAEAPAEAEEAPAEESAEEAAEEAPEAPAEEESEEEAAE